MLSNLAIISRFTEIFASGILIAGTIAFFNNYFSGKRLRDLFLSLIFLSLFIYIAAALASQMMYSMGRSLRELIWIQKGIYFTLTLCSGFLAAFILERFGLQKWRWLNFLVISLTAFFIFEIAVASVNLIYREGVVEPVVNFSILIPVKPFFALMWGVLSIFGLIGAFRLKAGERILNLYLAISAWLMLASMFSSFLYLRFGVEGYLVSAWILILVSTLGFLLAEIIPPDSPVARQPLSFFRTRILFKLLLIFVLLIVILFEATTLATLNISRSALSKAIINGYARAATELANKIENAAAKPSFDDLQNLVSTSKVDAKGLAFIVAQNGDMVAHPDKRRALAQENVKANEAVLAVVEGKSKGGEFRDELGSLMVGAYVPVKKFGWGVIIQEPIASAYFELRRLETNSLLFVIAGIVLTGLVGVFFARSIEKPMKELINGAEAVAKGDLRWRVTVDSADEIGKLAIAFNQMTKDMRDSQERLVLSEKLASLGTMAAGMAHEIKNPLVSLRTFTQLLQYKWEDKEFREKFSSIIPHEIERINRIAESLLKFGKPMAPEFSKVDVNAILDEVLVLFEIVAKKNNVHVTKKLAELPPISGDPGLLQQAFVNIIKNAIESMSEGGGELICKTDVGEVVRVGKTNKEGKKVGEEMVWGEQAAEAKEAGEVMPVIFIEVTDTGGGIPDENLKSLFDPFFTTKMTGTGMGLPITLRIIEEHKGSIKVRSQIGKGTTFIITLPQQH